MKKEIDIAIELAAEELKKYRPADYRLFGRIVRNLNHENEGFYEVGFDQPSTDAYGVLSHNPYKFVVDAKNKKVVGFSRDL